MSIDKLQEQIRKSKTPLVVDFNILPTHIPFDIIKSTDSFLNAYEQYCTQMLFTLKDIVPAVRFNFGSMAVLGPNGIEALQKLLQTARKYGFYIFLDGIDALSTQSAENVADIMFSSEYKLCFDGLIMTAYIGSDSIVPYVQRIDQTDKDLFVVARTSNKSAPEMQDLLSGTRLAHFAKADVVNRFAETHICRCGYSKVAIMAAASSADSIRMLRTKYKRLFMLLDGGDYPNANMKNCSYAFDQFGHGAVVCVGNSVCAAWQTEENQSDYFTAAVRAVERAKKNLLRYVTIL